jgi:hypothetical protein
MVKAYQTPWTLEEIQALCTVMDLTPEQTQKMFSEYKIWGGVPRTLIGQVFGQALQLEDVVRRFDIDKVKVFDDLNESISGDDKITYKILHLIRLPPATETSLIDRATCRYASHVVAEAVMTRAVEDKQWYIWTCIRQCKNTQLPLIYQSWEVAAIDFFMNNLQTKDAYIAWVGSQKWQYDQEAKKWSKSRLLQRDQIKWGPADVKKISYTSYITLKTELGAQLDKRCCLLPFHPNEETVDATWYIPGTRDRPTQLIFLQPTFAESHTIKLHGLRVFLQALKDIVDPEQLLLILVTPPKQTKCSPKLPEFSTDIQKRNEELAILEKLTVLCARVTSKGLTAVQRLFSTSKKERAAMIGTQEA